jgi:hypothetical protein
MNMAMIVRMPLMGVEVLGFLSGMKGKSVGGSWRKI